MLSSSSSSTLSSFTLDLDLESGVLELDSQQQHEREHDQHETTAPESRIPPKNHNVDLNLLVLAFCLTSGVDIAINSARNKLPPCYEFMSFAILLAFASLFLARFMTWNNPEWSLGLERAGIFFATTAFFMAIAFSFSSSLKLMSFVIYILSLLAIISSNWKNFGPTVRS